MNSRRVWFTGALAVFLVGLMGVAASAQSPDEYVVTLTGRQEVPPVVTSARSLGFFRFVDSDRLLIGIRLNYGHDQEVTDIHIHEAPRGEDGPIVLQMRPTTAEEGICIDLYGGVITYYALNSNALRGSLAGKTLTDLKNLMATGDTYFNLHTPENPGGWIRGQMIPRPSAPASE